MKTAVLVLLPSLAHATEHESTLPGDPEAIYGGQLAETCQWPSSVSIQSYDGLCTASLVHPEIVVAASHCLESGPMEVATLGEDSWSPQREVAIAECQQHPNYALDYPDYADFMYCRLAEPILDVPIVPVLMGCETEGVVSGASVVIAGYGTSNNGGPEGAKRWVATTIDYLEDTRVFFVGGTGHGTCYGDSGGPAYLQLADGSWRVFATTTGGEVCGGAAQSELIHEFVPWLEAQTGIDVTPCHDADGTWAPTVECGAFPAEPDVAHGDWSSMCSDAPRTGPSATCGPAFGEDASDESSGGTSSGGDESGESSDAGTTESDDDDSPDDPDPDTGFPPRTTTDPSAPLLAEDPPNGCACTVTHERPTALAWLLAVVAIARRRRAFTPA